MIYASGRRAALALLCLPCVGLATHAHGAAYDELRSLADGARPAGRTFDGSRAVSAAPATAQAAALAPTEDPAHASSADSTAGAAARPNAVPAPAKPRELTAYEKENRRNGAIAVGIGGLALGGFLGGGLSSAVGGGILGGVLLGLGLLGGLIGGALLGAYLGLRAARGD